MVKLKNNRMVQVQMTLVSTLQWNGGGAILPTVSVREWTRDLLPPLVTCLNQWYFDILGRGVINMFIYHIHIYL